MFLARTTCKCFNSYLIPKLLLLGLAGQRSVGNTLQETFRDFLREHLLHMRICNESQYIPRQKARFEGNSSNEFGLFVTDSFNFEFFSSRLVRENMWTVHRLGVELDYAL
jgi:hypothetical protein